jgi:hypothetical protein
MAFNTGNPIGSTDARDLSDNAQDFDQAVNGLGSTWVDRLGNTRTSLRVQVGYTGTGTDGAIESYTTGLVLPGYNTIILYSGEFYRPSASATLPYTTTATLPDVDSNLVSIGDANLRQDLANDASGSGASLVSMEGGPTVEAAVLDRVIRVTSIAAMEAYSAPVGYVFSLNDGGRSGTFDVLAGDFSSELTADSNNAIYIGFSDDVTAATKVAKRRYSGPVKAGWSGAALDGATDDRLFIEELQDAGYSVIDLEGKTAFTTIARDDVTSNFVNGKLIYKAQLNDAQAIEENETAIEIGSIQKLTTKPPTVDWENKNLLWLGTSIPFFGFGEQTSYPDMFSENFSCTLVNNSWAGSHASFDIESDSTEINSVKALSMTEDDRLAGLALYGSSSAYDDSFDEITLASEQTIEARIFTPFQSTNFDYVFLDHNHNDRFLVPGVLNPVAVTINAITKGSTTDITLATNDFIVGDAISIDVTGIDKLHNFSGRVQAISGLVVTVSVDSSGFSGTFSSGLAYKLDRTTLYGAWNFIIRYIRYAATNAGADLPNIILSNAPSKYTNDNDDGGVYSTGKRIKDVADKYGFSYFDVAEVYEVTPEEHINLFPDTVHPSDVPTRKALAAVWIKWASGGSVLPFKRNEFLPGAPTDNGFKGNREALYNSFTKAFETPSSLYEDPSSIDSNFLSSFTTTGTEVSGSGAGLLFEYTPFDDVYITNSFTGAENPEFNLDVWFDTLPSSTGLPKTITLFRAYGATGANYEIQLVVTENEVNVVPVYFTSPNSGLTKVRAVGNSALIEAYNNEIKFIVLNGASSDGRLICSVNGVEISNEPINALNLEDITYYRAGVVFSNYPNPMDFYIYKIDVLNRTSVDYSDRFTGSFSSGSGQSVAVVNGIITEAEGEEIPSEGLTFEKDDIAADNTAPIYNMTLGSYEVGEFVPEVVGSSSAGTATYIQQVGSFTRIGQLVTCAARIQWSSFNGTGNLQITGFPYKPKYTALASIMSENLTFTGTLCAKINSFTYLVDLYGFASNTAKTAVSVDATGIIDITITYEIFNQFEDGDVLA